MIRFKILNIFLINLGKFFRVTHGFKGSPRPVWNTTGNNKLKKSFQAGLAKTALKIFH